LQTPDFSVNLKSRAAASHTELDLQAHSLAKLDTVMPYVYSEIEALDPKDIRHDFGLETITEVSNSAEHFRQYFPKIIAYLNAEVENVTVKQVSRAARMAAFYSTYFKTYTRVHKTKGGLIWGNGEFAHTYDEIKPDMLINAVALFNKRIEVLRTQEQDNPAVHSSYNRFAPGPQPSLPPPSIPAVVEQPSTPPSSKDDKMFRESTYNIMVKVLDEINPGAPIGRFKHKFDFGKNTEVRRQHAPRQHITTFRHIQYEGEFREDTTAKTRGFHDVELPVNLTAAIKLQTQPSFFLDSMLCQSKFKSTVFHQRDFKFVNAHPRLACVNDVKIILQLADEILRMLEDFAKLKTSFTVDEIQPFRYVLWYKYMLEWPAVGTIFYNFIVWKLRPLELGVSPTAVISKLIAILEYMQDQPSDDRINLAPDLSDTDFPDLLETAQCHGTFDEVEFKVNKAYVDHHDEDDGDLPQNSLGDACEAFHPLPHLVPEDKCFDKKTRLQLFQTTSRAEELLDESGVRSPTRLEVEEARGLIPTLKSVYLTDVKSLWTYDDSRDESESDSETDENDDENGMDSGSPQDFKLRPKVADYIDLELLPRWYMIPRLVSHLIWRLKLSDLQDLDAQFGLDNHLHSARKAMELRASAARSQGDSDVVMADDPEMDTAQADAVASDQEVVAGNNVLSMHQEDLEQETAKSPTHTINGQAMSSQFEDPNNAAGGARSALPSTEPSMLDIKTNLQNNSTTTASSPTPAKSSTNGQGPAAPNLFNQRRLPSFSFAPKPANPLAPPTTDGFQLDSPQSKFAFGGFGVPSPGPFSFGTNPPALINPHGAFDENKWPQALPSDHNLRDVPKIIDDGHIEMLENRLANLKSALEGATSQKFPGLDVQNMYTHRKILSQDLEEFYQNVVTTGKDIPWEVFVTLKKYGIIKNLFSSRVINLATLVSEISGGDAGLGYVDNTWEFFQFPSFEDAMDILDDSDDGSSDGMGPN
ncbi:hypothetical protein KCU93_g2677, partial [Aureobasidium melanogenum]